MRPYVHLATCLMLILSCAAGALCQSVWTWCNPLPANIGTVKSAVNAGGTIIAVGDNGLILSSYDGLTWKNRSYEKFSSFTSVAWSGNRLVAAGYGGVIALSSDTGSTWTFLTDHDSPYYHAVSWCDDHFISTVQREVFASLDGTNWTYRGVCGTTQSSIVTGHVWIGSQLIAVNNHGEIYATPDDNIWTQVYSVASSFNSVVWNGSTAVAVGSRGEVAVSNDGLAWRGYNAGTSLSLRGVVWANGIFIALGDSGLICTSPDGQIWSKASKGIHPLNTAFYSNGHWYAMGEYGYRLSSVDGETWIPIGTSITDQDLHSIVRYGSRFVTVGDSGNIFTSSDGTSWARQISGVTSCLRSVTRKDSLLVAVGDLGIILTSPDAETWTKRHDGGETIYGAAWNGRQLVSVVDDDSCLTSPDGFSWTWNRQITMDRTGTYPFYSIAAADTQFVAVGPAGNFMIGNGTTFTAGRFSGISAFNSVAWTGKVIYVVGLRGAEYGQAPPLRMSMLVLGGGSVDWHCVAWDGSLLMIGGIRGSMMTKTPTSEDPFGSSNSRRFNCGSPGSILSIASDGNRYVAVGEMGVIMTSQIDRPTTTVRRGNQIIENSMDVRSAPGTLSFSTPASLRGHSVHVAVSSMNGARLIEFDSPAGSDIIAIPKAARSRTVYLIEMRGGGKRFIFKFIKF